jgi:hypothetical protein
MVKAKPHLEEAGKAMDEVLDVTADYQLTVRNKFQSIMNV